MNIADLFFSFAGRINRGKFWLGNLILFVIGLILLAANYALLGGPYSVASPDDIEKGADPLIWGSVPAVVAYALQVVVSMVMGFAVLIKRCHDRGKSGWWSLLLLIPIVGFIWMIIDLGIMEGDEGPNQYGPNPLNGAS